VQFLVELSSDDGGRVSGQINASEGPSTPFSGWLELLRVLEDGLHDRRQQDDPALRGLDGQGMA
jgi:hypothetical protein